MTNSSATVTTEDGGRQNIFAKEPQIQVLDKDQWAEAELLNGRLAMIGGMTGVLKDVIPFGLSFGNRNYLRGINIIGLKRKKYDNKKIMELDTAFKKIFSSKNLHENLNKINGEFKGNDLVTEVINFISKDKKRPICTPNSE